MTPEETLNAPRGWLGQSRVILGAVLIVVILTAFSAIEAWSLSQPATRAEISSRINEMEPACRPIVGIRMRARLVDEGRPLTRREMHRIVDDVSSCGAINEQLSGLEDITKP